MPHDRSGRQQKPRGQRGQNGRLGPAAPLLGAFPLHILRAGRLHGLDKSVVLRQTLLARATNQKVLFED